MISLLLSLVLLSSVPFSSGVTVEGGRIAAGGMTVGGTEVLAAADVPVFEVCINGKTLTSRDPVWKLAETTSRKLSNGGTVTTYHFSGKGAWNGLNVFWDRETFGDEAFLRERLRLSSSRPGKFRFTDKDGSNHFLFPQYVLAGTATQARETRIATFDKEALDGFNPAAAMSTRPPRNLSGCHMFHPDRIVRDLPCEVKGPFLSAEVGGRRVLTSYEHASQDNTWMNVGKASGNDDAVGSAGRQHVVSDDDLWFISTSMRAVEGGTLVSSAIRRGGYIDGEAVPAEGFYETVWYTISFPDVPVDEAIREYLYSKITDNAAARRSDFYYNTWGMQRSAKDMRAEFNEKRVLEEIDLAAQLGVETFIFDDGWQQNFGEWTPHRDRLPSGLSPLVEALRSKGITPGIWLGFAAASLSSPVAKEHPEWVIKDLDGRPDIVQWGCPAMDLTGGYYDRMLGTLKYLVDQGIRFFKWDGINFYSSDLAGLGHGSASDPVKARIDRYNYLLPFKVTSLMREIREYCPEVVIEIDLTEHERALVGLMPLQEGKLFWMNNGASWYEDFSQFRTKSMRRITSEITSLIPQEALTYAVYPFNAGPWHSLHYNICTTIQSGHGFWGNLKKCTKQDIASVSYYVRSAKRVLAEVAGAPLETSGQVGSSPEIYVQKKGGWALVTAFSGAPCEYELNVCMDTAKVLGVTGHSFSVTSDSVILPLQFSCADDSRAAFVIGGADEGHHILSSTGWLSEVELKDGRLHIRAGSDTDIAVLLAGSGIRKTHIAAGQEIVL